MADTVTYSRIVEIIDNSQYIDALKKAEAEEKLLTDLRARGGAAAVKAFRETEKAQARAAAESVKALKAEQAKAAKEAAYLETLRQNYLRAEEAARKLQQRQEEAAAAKAAKGPSEWTLALKANAAAQEAASKELATFRGQVNLGAESLGKIGTALTAIDPALGAVAQGVQKVTGVVSAGAAGMQLFGASVKSALALAGGPVAIAAAAATAAVAFAYDEYAESAKAAEEAEKAAKEETERATEAHEKLTKAIRDQRIEQDRLAGRISDTDAKIKGAANTMKDEYGPRLDAAKKKLDEARAAQEEWRRSMGPMDEALETDKIKLEQLIAATGDAAVEYSNLQTAYKTSLRQQKEIIQTTDEQAKGKEKEKETTKASAAATRDATEAARERERIEAMLLTTLLDRADAEIQRAATLEDAKSSLADLKRASEEALATEEERIQLAAQAAREAAVAVANEAQAASDSAAERKQIAQDLAATLININVDVARKFKTLEDEKAEKAKETSDKIAAENEKRVAAVQSLASSSVDLFDAIMESNREAAENGSKSAQKAMLRQFEAQRVSGIAEAVINTAVAISAANTIPAPFNIAAIAAAAATGAAQITTIASQQPPTFTDTPPGGYRLGPGGQTVQGAANDTAILFRDPLEGFAQAVEVMARRQAPTSTPTRGARPRLGVSVATTPVSRLLTRDVERATRGRL